MSASGRSFKRTIVGRRMPMGSLEDELLPRWIALPIFASDPLSSVAYATEAALVVLVATSVASRELIVPISAVIAALLVVVVLSYRQTIFAYPNGGGSYVVAKENLGQMAGLVAAASLLIDYVLTAAVSIASGVLAVTSAVPELSTHAVELSLGVLVVLVLVNLRGVRESGFVFALPDLRLHHRDRRHDRRRLRARHAVSAGRRRTCPTRRQVGPRGRRRRHRAPACLRLGLQRADGRRGDLERRHGVPAPAGAQRREHARVDGRDRGHPLPGRVGPGLEDGRAAERFGVGAVGDRARGLPAGRDRPSATTPCRRRRPRVLALAANTAFQGFPRLAALLASDSFLPRQFSNLGDRLVYSNGILVLALAAGALIVGFHADVISLIHLYLLGVFTAFTLSQLGMVRHNWRRRGAGDSRAIAVLQDRPQRHRRRCSRASSARS